MTALAAARRVDPVRAALWYLGIGCTAFPVWGSEDGRCRCGDPHDGTRRHGPDNVGKHPSSARGFKDATADPECVRTFLGNPGTPNYGLNPPAGVFVLDVDGDGIAEWARLEARLGALPPTLTTLTANGRHVWLRWPERLGPMPAGKLWGFVTRRRGDGYIIGPGSVHPTGFTYDAERGPDGQPRAIAELPEAWARDALRQADASPIRVGGELPAVGGRHDWLRDKARHYAGVIRDPVALEAAVMAENAKLPVPKSPSAVRQAIGEVLAKFAPDPVDPETGARIVSAQTRGGVGRNSPEPPKVLDDLRFYTAAEVAAMTPEVIDWAWRDYLAHGTILELVGPPKAGKTTLVLELIRALVDGQPFLDRPTAAGPVVVLTEQGPASLRAVLVRTGIADRGDVHLLLHRDIRGRRWGDVVATAHAYCTTVGARILVVDTLPAFAGLAGDAENSAGEALAAMEPLQAAAADGLAVLVNRHRRKNLPGLSGGSGDIADEGRGSGAFSGAVDVILSLRRPAGGTRPTVRELVSASRFDETPEKVVVELRDGRYIALGEDAAVESAEAREKVLLLLDDVADGLSMARLEEATGKTRQTLQRVVDDLVRTRDLERMGTGKRGDAYRWRRTDAGPGSLIRFPSVSSHGAWAETNRDPGAVSAQAGSPYGGEPAVGQKAMPDSGADGAADSDHVICHSYHDHQLTHGRGRDGLYHCPTCSPEEGPA